LDFIKLINYIGGLYMIRNVGFSGCSELKFQSKSKVRNDNRQFPEENENNDSYHFSSEIEPKTSKHKTDLDKFKPHCSSSAKRILPENKHNTRLVKLNPHHDEINLDENTKELQEAFKSLPKKNRH
jgi:hypothetical protein